MGQRQKLVDEPPQEESRRLRLAAGLVQRLASSEGRATARRVVASGKGAGGSAMGGVERMDLSRTLGRDPRPALLASPDPAPCAPLPHVPRGSVSAGFRCYLWDFVAFPFS